MREVLRKIIAGILVITFSYLLLANILHFVAVREKKPVMGLGESNTTVMKKDYQILQDNLTKLSTITKTEHLDEENYQKVLSLLKEGEKKISDSDIMKMNIPKKYTDVDVMELIKKDGKISNLNIINAYQLVINHDENSGFDKDEVISECLSTMMNLSTVQNKVLTNYIYHTPDNGILTVVGIELPTIYMNSGKKVTLLRVLSDYLVKDGGLHA